MASVKLADNAYGTLGGALASTASSITFTSGHGARFPAVAAGECLYVCLLNSNNVLEEIQITTHTASADTADVVRAVGATTAKAWNAGDRIEARLSSTAILNKHADPLAVTGTGSSTIAGPLAVAKSLDLSGAAAGQITFPDTQNASTGTATLDDYKERSWTPILTFGTSSDATYATQIGRVTKIGNRVFYNCAITLTDNGTGTGACVIKGLPYTSTNIANNSAPATVVVGQVLLGTSSGYYSPVAYVVENSAVIQIYQQGNSVSAVTIDSTAFANNATVQVSGSYQASS